MRSDAAFALKRELSDHRVVIVIEQIKALCEDDPELLADTVLGETEILEILDRVDTRILELEASIEGAAAVLKKFRERKARDEKRVETLYALVQNALEMIGLRKHRTSNGIMLSLTPLPVKAIVTDEVAVPTKWFKPAPQVIDQKGLTDYIRARAKALAEADKLDGELRLAHLRQVAAEYPEIPGVVQSNASFTLKRA